MVLDEGGERESAGESSCRLREPPKAGVAGQSLHGCLERVRGSEMPATPGSCEGNAAHREQNQPKGETSITGSGAQGQSHPSPLKRKPQARTQESEGSAFALTVSCAAAIPFSWNGSLSSVPLHIRNMYLVLVLQGATIKRLPTVSEETLGFMKDYENF